MATSGTFGLRISGNDAARYEATCYVETAYGTQTVEFSGAPPLDSTVEGQVVSCEVKQVAAQGRITVALNSPSGNVSRLSTSGPGSVITLSVD